MIVAAIEFLLMVFVAALVIIESVFISRNDRP